MATDNKRDIVHIKVGTPDWDPTEEDIERITEMFDTALHEDDESSLVITKEGIEVSLDRVEESETLRLFVVSVNRISGAKTLTEKIEQVTRELDATEMDMLANAPSTSTLQ